MWTHVLTAFLALSPVAQERVLVITGAHILDAQGEHWLDDRAVLVRGEKIEGVAPLASLRVPSDALRVDATGAWLVPGLIDLHTHLLLHPYDERAWNDQVLKESLELRTIRAVVQARATLEAGFTTVRELGTEGAGFADVALRDAIAEGLVPGPRIFAATRAIVATHCYAPAGFDPRWDVPCGAEEATGVAEVRRAVRAQVAAGADWIKVYADYRRAPGEPATPSFSKEELEALVDEARSAKKPVAAHASTDEGVRRAVLAGVNTIEHGYAASRATLELMQERGVVLCPTLAANEASARYAGWKDGAPPASVLRARELVRTAHEAGVTIACGSDAGVFAHGTNARELELLAAAGLAPTEALRAATMTAARVLGHEGELGRIDAGFVADLVALAADPLADPAALRSIRFVVQRGRVVVDRR
ncbi:MAG: amidohydrolase family protein [Planctomycetes bacterium]|nr:amidohydrolase family protein [Planctomycetota bacterium]